MHNYDGWCQRIDLKFRALYPYIHTRLFKLGKYEYQLYLLDEIDNFEELEQLFSYEIRYVTAPIKLVNIEPKEYLNIIGGIDDNEIPNGFSGFPLTINQLHIHIESIHSDIKVSNINDNHDERKIIIELEGQVDPVKVSQVENTVKSLECVYPFKVSTGGDSNRTSIIQNHVFNIAPSSHFKKLGCEFIERDEHLWFENVENIYKGKYKKNDLYFFDSNKTSCLVNFSKFSNINIRNHLLLYDVIYCVLPLSQGMPDFLNSQKITRDELIELVARGRIKILNMQPEFRVDYGLFNEMYKENPNGVVSRRALSALCAMDLVEINSSYIFSDPEIDKHKLNFLKEIASINNQDLKTLSQFLFWPVSALRNSIDTLNFSGPMGISRYGVNNPIINSLCSQENKEAINFEFIVNSDQIHIAHALDSTYFPFHVNNDKYTDYPFALIMGNMLNFYRNFNDDSVINALHSNGQLKTNNPSLSLISIFDINDYISVSEFESEISSSVIRSGMNSLFLELSQLDEKERKHRIDQYNIELKKALKVKKTSMHALDLAEDVIGLIIPFLNTRKKVIKGATKLAMNKFPAIQAVSEYIEDKTNRRSGVDRNISLLSQVNRVAKLKIGFD